ncbi:MAG TPA: hypothetical protein VK188_16650 [Holophaga sp.]|nr:hypothetical protein [Holophaga sp.]
MARRGLAGALLLPAALFLACRREDARIRELTVRAAQADEAAQELRAAWRAQLVRLPRLRVRPPAAAPLAIPFTPEQVRFLQARVNAERDVSLKALLQEALDQDRRIRDLGERLERLGGGLPVPDQAGPGDSHHGLALRFLKGRGIPDDRARAMLAQARILPRIAPGFLVYHFLVDGAYATWVAQGSAPFTPAALNGEEDLERLGASRDAARARSGGLDLALAALLARKRALELEVSQLRLQREHDLEARDFLRAEGEEADRTLGSLHFLVATREDLEAADIVALPFLGRSRAGPGWQDALFVRHLDLRRERILLIRAVDLGLPRIERVQVVPGAFEEGLHYRVTFGPGRMEAAVELLEPDRFRNGKVVFAVS